MDSLQVPFGKRKKKKEVLIHWKKIYLIRKKTLKKKYAKEKKVLTIEVQDYHILFGTVYLG